MTVAAEAEQLALSLLRLQALVDETCFPAVIRRPSERAYVSINPGDTGPNASTNRNRIMLAGDGGLTRRGFADLFDLFAREDVDRFFVWLTPGPGRETVEAWLEQKELQPNAWVDYLALACVPSLSEPPRTELTVREVTPEEAGALGADEDVAWPQLIPLSGRPDVSTWFAFDGERPVASALLWVHEDIGYLGWGLTREADRGRGAQSALIAARMARAHELGLRLAVSETLSILKASLANLQRAGLQVLYDKPVYEVRRG